MGAIIVGMRNGAGEWLGLSTSERLPFLEGMRGILAIYVVLGHIASMADPSGLAGRRSDSPEWMQRLLAPFAYGHLAVAGFIVLSGFCLQLSLYASGNGTVKHLGRFFLRRARRILPTYYAALIISLAVCFTVTNRLAGMPFELYVPVTPENTWAHIFLIHNWNPDWMYKINGVMWSIAIEAQLYIVFPALAWLVSRRHSGSRWGMLVGAYAVAAVVTETAPNGLKLYPWYLALFATGMFAASLAYRPLSQRAVSLAPGWIAATGSILYLGFAIALRWELPLRDIGIAGLVSALAYVWTVDSHHWLARSLGSRPLYWLGSMSYSLYLVHHPIQQVFYFWRPIWVNTNDRILIYLTAVLPINIALAWLFYRVFERPFARGNSDTDQEPPDAFFPKRFPLRTATSD